ncbi:hypothetical protein RI367_004561 [Sorochytrium milnesiophthora]
MGNSWSTDYDANAPVDLRHFKLGRSIGRGAFGKVKVVVKRDTKKLYALKYINKDQCIRKRAYRNIFRERTLLERLEHSFIVNLRFAFQDDENMFMVIDLMLGGDLRFHLQRMGKFTERMCVFYAAELSNALVYLHSQGVLHRDLKPDNILLDQWGHAHLTDFNCATIIEPDKEIISETGTQGYMAPEVYGSKGYTEAVDWWSLGVVLWECLHGQRPFNASRVDRLIYRVQNAPLVYSDDMSRRMRSLLEGLLERDVSLRLSSHEADGDRYVLRHPVFKRIEWDKLIAKAIVPPFVPDARKVNFDARYELEEILLEENPLSAKPRKNKDNAGLSREMRLIEAEFLPFDFTHCERTDGAATAATLQLTSPRESHGHPVNWVRCTDPPQQPDETSEQYDERRKQYWLRKQRELKDVLVWDEDVKAAFVEPESAAILATDASKLADDDDVHLDDLGAYFTNKPAPGLAQPFEEGADFVLPANLPAVDKMHSVRSRRRLPFGGSDSALPEVEENRSLEDTSMSTAASRKNTSAWGAFTTKLFSSSSKRRQQSQQSQHERQQPRQQDERRRRDSASLFSFGAQSEHRRLSNSSTCSDLSKNRSRPRSSDFLATSSDGKGVSLPPLDFRNAPPAPPIPNDWRRVQNKSAAPSQVDAERDGSPPLTPESSPKAQPEQTPEPLPSMLPAMLPRVQPSPSPPPAAAAAAAAAPSSAAPTKPKTDGVGGKNVDVPVRTDSRHFAFRKKPNSSSIVAAAAAMAAKYGSNGSPSSSPNPMPVTLPAMLPTTIPTPSATPTPPPPTTAPSSPPSTQASGLPSISFPPPPPLGSLSSLPPGNSTSSPPASSSPASVGPRSAAPIIPLPAIPQPAATTAPLPPGTPPPLRPLPNVPKMTPRTPVPLVLQAQALARVQSPAKSPAAAPSPTTPSVGDVGQTTLDQVMRDLENLSSSFVSTDRPESPVRMSPAPPSSRRLSGLVINVKSSFGASKHPALGSPSRPSVTTPTTPTAHSKLVHPGPRRA